MARDFGGITINYDGMSLVFNEVKQSIIGEDSLFRFSKFDIWVEVYLCLIFDLPLLPPMRYIPSLPLHNTQGNSNRLICL